MLNKILCPVFVSQPEEPGILDKLSNLFSSDSKDEGEGAKTADTEETAGDKPAGDDTADDSGDEAEAKEGDGDDQAEDGAKAGDDVGSDETDASSNDQAEEEKTEGEDKADADEQKTSDETSEEKTTEEKAKEEKTTEEEKSTDEGDKADSTTKAEASKEKAAKKAAAKEPVDDKPKTVKIALDAAADVRDLRDLEASDVQISRARLQALLVSESGWGWEGENEVGMIRDEAPEHFSAFRRTRSASVRNAPAPSTSWRAIFLTCRTSWVATRSLRSRRVSGLWEMIIS